MLTHITIWYFIVKLSIAQLNGDFWWLNDRLTNYNDVRPPPPKFENLTEFDNDESAKIVFRDENLITNSFANDINNINFTEATRGKDEHNVNKDIKSHVENEHLKGQANKPDLTDRFVFKFPEDDNFVWKDISNAAMTKVPVTENGIEGSSDFENENQFENNCNFMKESECYRINGLVHQLKYVKKIDNNQQLICCVFALPSKHKASSKIYFPDNPRDTSKRRKRSNDEHDHLKQRNILLQRRHTHSSRQGTTQRIATPEYDDDDPYWNIKTFKISKKQPQVTEKHDYSTDDYKKDYASEIPKPGLTGIYSDNMKPDWPSHEKKHGEYSDEYDYVNDDDNDDDVDDDSGTFGYSTVDPRRDSKLKSKRRPIKLTATSVENSYNAESQTITYESKPNFNVLQGFKLLLKNKGRPKIRQRSTTVDSIIDVSNESLGNEEEDVDESSDVDDELSNRQVYQDCGETVPLSKINTQDKQIGETVNGSHPWLAIVVPSRKWNSILCYATLIHPRAAITVAHCVYRKSPGEITLLTGMWDLNEMAGATNRAVSVQIHSKYRHGELTHNLAMLNWIRPLETNVNVQPACLAGPHIGDECMFFGWGGFDQAMNRKPRWQRASVHSCEGNLSFVSGGSLPSDAFCATVVSRNTVTGMGGSLMCNSDGRLSAVGVAITRDTTLALLPIHQWTLATMATLNE